MRSVNEIILAVQEQQPATEEELRLALLCIDYEMTISTETDWNEASPALLRSRASEQFSRRFRMGKADPKEWLGRRWLPGTEENRRAREVSMRIAKKAGVL